MLERFELQTQAGSHWPLFCPCCGSYEIRWEKGIIEAFFLWQPFRFLHCFHLDSPGAVEAGRVASRPMPADEGPQASSCPLQLSQEPPGLRVRGQAHAPGGAGSQLQEAEISCEGLWSWAWGALEPASGYPFLPYYLSCLLILPISLILVDSCQSVTGMHFNNLSYDPFLGFHGNSIKMEHSNREFQECLICFLIYQIRLTCRKHTSDISLLCTPVNPHITECKIQMCYHNLQGPE